MGSESSYSFLRKQEGGVRLKTATRSKTDKLGEVERVYHILHEWLKTAKLSPGEFLSELDLAERCGTSRTPVREACSRLMQDKWLSRIRRKGFMVTPISVRDIVDMYEYRKLLESFTAEKVARVATEEQIKELRAVGTPESSATVNLADILRANGEFHRRLSELAGNQRVTSQLSLTLDYVTRLDTLCTQTVPGWIGHTDILRAIESHEPAQARQAMQVHIDDSRDKMIKLFSS
jgi:GntR family transcriptional regulator, rspAB operon transcriptional repressor